MTMTLKRRKSSPNSASTALPSKSTPERPGQDLHRTLSEVAAPEPIQRATAADLARRPSLNLQLSTISAAKPDAESDMFGALSEVAIPEPVKRCGADEIGRRPSLDRSLSHASGGGED
ncbi:hypothetical protein ATEIFO6365_0014010400 [Aspergillus terreus]|uniref:Uncharacterized protein n=1 Tax=Aspergillus terreus TaxID=33178 RepID=A0A5M3Z432_ASPTE|nr:hypothetical protein ATETN484_0008027100 [Aspergillus terreus]GFF21172.1 hypothetical protein ATEIFO6365_0014010400 [Aspergillus terreus]